MDYAYGLTGLEIGIDKITKEEAEKEIKRKTEAIPDFQFLVTSSVERGRYVPCPLSGFRSRSNNDAEMMIKKRCSILKPGIIIYSPYMEPNPGSNQSESGCAVYSGVLDGLGNGEVLGLTVGHLFLSKGIAVILDGCSIGHCLYKYEYIDHMMIGRTTADLALLRITQFEQTNEITFNGTTFMLRFFRGDLDSSADPIQVLIPCKDGSFQEGVITNSIFTRKPWNLFNTLCITCPKLSLKVTGEGDSGALVISHPIQSEDERVLWVYGMVIGYWESEDKSVTHTVATRLWNVMESIPDAPQNIEFWNGSSNKSGGCGRPSVVSSDSVVCSISPSSITNSVTNDSGFWVT